jgi:acetyltransferase
MPDSTIPQPALEPWTTRTGQDVVIRPICGDDETRMAQFHRSLSPETVYTRYFNAAKLSTRIAHPRLDGVCHPTPGDETVLVVEIVTPVTLAGQIVGVGRLSASPDFQSGEVAFVISDSHQRQGIGSELLRRLIRAAKEMGLPRLRAHMLPTNIAVRRMCANAGMRLAGGEDASEVTGEIVL